MVRKSLLLGFVAALAVAPMVVQASELSRRLTLRYPGQDARPHHRHRTWERHREDPPRGHDGGKRPGDRR